MGHGRQVVRLIVSSSAACLAAVALGPGAAAPAGAAGEATKTVTVSINDDAFGFEPNPTASTWGHVTSSPEGIDCPDTCSASFPSDSALQLTVDHDASAFTFAGWSVFGNDAGTQCDTQDTCSLTLADDTSDVSVEARLRPATTLWAIPEGAGTLTIDPPEAGRDPAECSVEHPVFAPLPAPCSPRYPTGTRITVTAHPDPNVDGARFVRWSDFRCSNSSLSCTVTMDGDVNLSAIFSPVYLSVVGGSFGPVTLTPPGTTCDLPSDPLGTSDPPCDFPYEPGTNVTLQRDPSAAQSATDEWTGACTGSGETCTLKMRKNELVRAGTDPTFDIPTPLGPPLRVLYKGPKGGKITLRSVSGPSRTVVCRGGCRTSAFTRYQRVVLSPTGNRRAKFKRWADVIRARLTPRPLLIGNVSVVRAVYVRR
jgi:hypothetical protein